MPTEFSLAEKGPSQVIDAGVSCNWIQDWGSGGDLENNPYCEHNIL